ncbi:MAG: pyridoxamine 5'-phosphate oxidase [Chlamydiales bacterium]
MKEGPLDVSHTRKNYNINPLRRSYMPENPTEAFIQWFKQVQDAQEDEANRMVLATCNLQGKVSSRTVLLKYVDERGFVFFTNYCSKKGVHLAENPYVSVTFYWPSTHRQVCIEGKAYRIAKEDSDRYFAMRPRQSQIAAWASSQDRAIAGRELLEDMFVQMEEEWAGREVQRPDYWGGYRIIPHFFDFWHGRPNRLHDRFHYILDMGTWRLYRVQP